MSTFFIAGEQRSGTTLLSVILSRHSKIHLDGNSIGFRLISCFVKFPPQVLPYNLRHSVKDVQAWLIEKDYKSRMADLIDYKSIDQFSDNRSAIQNGIEKRLSENGKTILGDKSPRIHYFMPELLTILPNTKFIHLIRDGRAVAVSRKRRADKNLLLGAQEWVDSNVLGMSNEALVGKGTYLFVKYEDLLTSPEKTLREICEFLKLDFEIGILSDQSPSKGAKSYVNSGLKTDKIDSYKTELSISQLSKVEKIQGPLLKRFGYVLDTELSDKNYKSLSLFRRIWLNQLDNLRQLLVSKRIGMRDRQNFEIKIPLNTRVKTYILELGRDFLPEKIFKRIFRKRWIKNIHMTK